MKRSHLKKKKKTLKALKIKTKVSDSKLSNPYQQHQVVNSDMCEQIRD